MALTNRMSLHPILLWLTLNPAVIFQCLSLYILYIFSFTYPVRCFRVPPKMSSRNPGVLVPQFEDLWTRELLQFSHSESRCCEKLITEDADSSGTQRKRNVRRWKPLPMNVREDVTLDICVYARARVCVCVCVCVIVKCEVCSLAV
jgi:hypothetical protein